MFDINKFNLVQDDNYYYVFRSLEAGDISDRKNGIADVMRTDRERYRREPKYKEDSNISLEEMFDHIKIHYRQDTNCISFTTSAAVASLYGRDTDSFEEGVFNDQYIILKIPKEELGTKSFFAPQYFIDEINKYLNNYYTSANDSVKNLFDSIDNCENQEQLDKLKSFEFSNSIFEGGIEFETTNSINYSTLTSEQNLAKNKLIAKIDLLPNNILGNATNKFLVQTLGSAFASMEVTHYKNISNKYLIDCPTYILDIFSILQQSNNTKIKEIEKIIIDKLSNNELNDLEPFKYYNYEITDEDLSIDKLYSISDNGKVDYNTMKNLYIKTFYLAKSKLRAYHSVKLLRNILGNGYDDVLSELLDTYGIEPKITNKQSIKKINISDSVGLSYSNEIERKLFYIINNNYTNIKDLELLINNKEDCVSIVMMDLLDENNTIDKEYYYCNAIIDSFDWKQFNVKSIDLRHRNVLTKRLKESNFMDIYASLENKNYSSKDISRIILSNIIKDNKEIDLDSSFTIEELQDYLGYFRLKNSNLKLTRYQANAVSNMKEAYERYNYTNVILPTGTGKSYVAISEMLNYLNNGKKVLYLAPDNEILYQIKYYLVSEIVGDNFLESNIDNIIRKHYPSLYLSTYSNLQRGKEGEQFLVTNFDFIVMDELHRTGASEWKDALETLYRNQKNKCKVLGITATPTRDCDGVDMAEYWASFFGYTEEEIYSNKHLAYNMDFNQAVTLGYLANPRVINCDYEFLTNSNEIKDYINLASRLNDEEEKQKIFSKLKNDIVNAKGIAELLKENINSDDRCLVFCPRVDFDETTGASLTDKEKIDKYKRKLEEIYGKDNIECYSMLSSYGANVNQKQLENFNNGSSSKIKFMLVLDKMNEGKHGKYNKLIWFRALDDNSFVLCSQQLGRISKLIKAGKTINEEERPLAIDIPNNLLRIQNDSKLRKSVKSDDISRFKLVVDWIKEYNKIPDINSKDYIESNMAGILKVIIFMYHKRIFDLDSIKDVKKSYQAKEIKRLAETLDFDIWNLYLPNRTKETKKRRHVPYYAKVNPIYRDYLDSFEKLKTITKFEDKINEIYELYLKNGSIPKTTSQVRFSDNSSLIGNWIYYYKDTILKFANEGNEKAKVIVEKLDLNNENLLFIERINEIYELYLETGKMPLVTSKKRFKDNSTSMGNWLRNNKIKIIEIANEGNKEAELIVEKLKFDVGKVSLDEKVDELYLVLKESNFKYFPASNDKDKKFSDGTVMGTFFRREKIKNQLLEKAQVNPKYMLICLDKGFIGINEALNYFDINYEIEPGIKLYDCIETVNRANDVICYILENKKLPSNSSLCSWVNGNKDLIIEYAKVKKICMFVCLQYQWISEKEIEKYYSDTNILINYKGKLTNFDLIKDNFFTNNLKECVEYYKLHCFMPQQKDKDEAIKKLGIFLISYKEKIIECAPFNPYAMFISLRVGNGEKNIWIKKEDALKYYNEDYMIDGIKLIDNNTLSFDDKVLETYNLLLNKKLNAKALFSDGTGTRNWRIKNSKEIINAAKNGNARAMYICLNAPELKDVFSKEEALKYYDENYKIDEVNLFEETEEFFDKRLNEVCEYFKENGSSISNCPFAGWLRANKDNIIKLANQGYDKAIYVCKQRKWTNNHISQEKTRDIKSLDIFYEKVKKLIKFYILNGRFPCVSDDTHEEYGCDLYNFMRRNRQHIIEQSKNDINCMFISLRAGHIPWISNEKALEVYSNTSCIEVVINDELIKLPLYEKSVEEKRIDAIYKHYLETGEMYPWNSTECFDDGVCIGNWISSSKHQILHYAELGNEGAKAIIRETAWGKNYVIRNAKINGFALKYCLDNDWILEKDAINYPAYKQLHKTK